MGVQVDKELCAGCGVCVEVCSTGAIHLVDDRAEIVNALCTQCYTCIDACPNGAITAISESARRTPIVALPAAETKMISVSDRNTLPETVAPVHGLAKAALAILGREVAPRLIDVLATALERRLTTPAMSATTSLSASRENPTRTRRGIRRQARYRGGRIGNRNLKGRR